MNGLDEMRLWSRIMATDSLVTVWIPKPPRGVSHWVLKDASSDKISVKQ
jgi:hypothetical protein